MTNPIEKKWQSADGQHRKRVGHRLQALWAWLVKLDGERSVTIDRLDDEGDD